MRGLSFHRFRHLTAGLMCVRFLLRASKWLIMNTVCSNINCQLSFSVFLPFLCYCRSKKLVKCEREICVKFTPVCCITIAKKTCLFISLSKRDEDFSNANVHFEF